MIILTFFGFFMLFGVFGGVLPFLDVIFSVLYNFRFKVCLFQKRLVFLLAFLHILDITKFEITYSFRYSCLGGHFQIALCRLVEGFLSSIFWLAPGFLPEKCFLP